jgi:hypothetical protein
MERIWILSRIQIRISSNYYGSGSWRPTACKCPYTVGGYILCTGLSCVQICRGHRQPSWRMLSNRPPASTSPGNSKHTRYTVTNVCYSHLRGCDQTGRQPQQSTSLGNSKHMRYTVSNVCYYFCLLPKSKTLMTLCCATLH